jgi:hypothetical protein
MRERERLIARIRQIRRVAAAPVQPLASAPISEDAARVDALEARLGHLEQMVEGLQDSVHREAERHDRLIAELQAQIRPAALGAALSKDARDRGLES